MTLACEPESIRKLQAMRLVRTLMSKLQSYFIFLLDIIERDNFKLLNKLAFLISHVTHSGIL